MIARISASVRARAYEIFGALTFASWRRSGRRARPGGRRRGRAAERARTWLTRRRRQAGGLHLSQHQPDVVGLQIGQLPAPDDRRRRDPHEQGRSGRRFASRTSRSRASHRRGTSRAVSRSSVGGSPVFARSFASSSFASTSAAVFP